MSYTAEQKADRVDFAFRTLRDEYRAGGRLRIANELNAIVQGETVDFKAKVFDLITTHETPGEALQSLPHTDPVAGIFPPNS